MPHWTDNLWAGVPPSTIRALGTGRTLRSADAISILGTQPMCISTLELRVANAHSIRPFGRYAPSSGNVISELHNFKSERDSVFL